MTPRDPSAKPQKGPNVDPRYIVPRRPKWFTSFVDPSARNEGQHRSARCYFINEKEVIRDWTPRNPDERRHYLKQKEMYSTYRDPAFADPKSEQGWNPRAGTEASSYNHKVFVYRRYIQHDYRPQAAAALAYGSSGVMDPRVFPATWTRGITSSVNFSSSPFARENVHEGEDPLLDTVIEQSTARLTALAVVNAQPVTPMANNNALLTYAGESMGRSPRSLHATAGTSSLHRTQRKSHSAHTPRASGAYEPWVPYRPDTSGSVAGVRSHSPLKHTQSQDRLDNTSEARVISRSPSPQNMNRTHVIGNAHDGFYSKSTTASMASRALKLISELEQQSKRR